MPRATWVARAREVKTRGCVYRGWKVIAPSADRGGGGEIFSVGNPATGAQFEDMVRDAGAGDILLVMSNGSFGGIHEKLLAALGIRPSGVQPIAQLDHQDVVGPQLEEVPGVPTEPEIAHPVER